jgi:hypothetical protein
MTLTLQTQEILIFKVKTVFERESWFATTFLNISLCYVVETKRMSLQKIDIAILP